MGNTRAPTAKELKLYNRLQSTVKRAALTVVLNDSLAWQTQEALAYGLQQGERIPMTPIDLEQRRFDLSRKVGRLVNLVNSIEQQKLGIRLSKNQNDLDIYASPEANDDEIAKWQEPSFGIHPVVWVIAGVLIVAGALAAAYKIMEANTAITAEYNRLLAETDKKYCSVPSSDLCKKWLSRKSEQDYQQKVGLADQARKEIASIGSGISSGLSTGLLLALPIVALYVFSRDK